MLKEDYCSFEVAKLLCEKGFDWECETSYYISNKGCENAVSVGDFTKVRPWREALIAAPTHQMAMKWLRDEKNILLYVYPVINLPVKDDNTFHWRWDGKKKIYCAPHIGEKHNYESFEDAVEAALKYSLENLI